MKKILIAAALAAASTFALHGVAGAHGGTYRGPGDLLPPGGGGGPSGPGQPGTPGPTTGGPGGPTHPGPTSPGGVPSGPTGTPGMGPGSGGQEAGLDLTQWQLWWDFNKEPYLQLKAAVHSGGILTGSDEFYLGRNTQEQVRDSLAPSRAAIRGTIVPALLRALERERSSDIVTGGMVALARIGEDERDAGAGLAAAIRRKLGDPNQEIAETAAVALGILASEREIGLLAALLERDAAALRALGVSPGAAESQRTRAFAAYGLGLIGAKAGADGRRAIAASLRGILDGEGRRLQRDVPVACVTALGLTPLPLAAAQVPADVDPRKLPAVASLQTRQDQLLYLWRLYGDEQRDVLVRAHVPAAMARLLAGVPEDDGLRRAIVRGLAAALSRHTPVANELRQSAVLALGQIADCDGDEADVGVRRALMGVKDELRDQQSRHFALIALARIGSRPGTGVGSPLAGLEPGRESVRHFLMEQAMRSRGQTRPWAHLSLGVLERGLRDHGRRTSDEVRELLRRELVEAKPPGDVGAAAVALGRIGDVGAKEDLLAKLGRVGDPEARGYCAVALGMIGEAAAIEPITAIVRRSTYQPELLKSAAIALGLLGDKRIVDDLTAMLDEAKALSSQAALAGALGFIGDARSVDPLVALLEDAQKTDRARGFAAAALGIVADKETLPWNAKLSADVNYRAATPTLTEPGVGTGILDML